MARVRKIVRNPSNGINYYLIDACFLANRYIPARRLRGDEKVRVERCSDWWKEIDAQLAAGAAIVYVPDVCIAEAFKVLAKKYYKEKVFPNRVFYHLAKQRLSKDITVSKKTLTSANRKIRFHDISTSRDVIIAVDRFLESFNKHNIIASLPDLIILATAKYLIDFYKIPFDRLIIVTTDGSLHRGSRLFPDIPNAFDPKIKNEFAENVFVDEQLS
jgi:hypothetical protein